MDVWRSNIRIYTNCVFHILSPPWFCFSTFKIKCRASHREMILTNQMLNKKSGYWFLAYHNSCLKQVMENQNMMKWQRQRVHKSEVLISWIRNTVSWGTQWKKIPTSKFCFYLLYFNLLIWLPYVYWFFWTLSVQYSVYWTQWMVMPSYK